MKKTVAFYKIKTQFILTRPENNSTTIILLWGSDAKTHFLNSFLILRQTSEHFLMFYKIFIHTYEH